MKGNQVQELIGGNTSSWPVMRRLVRLMTVEELQEADRIERLGKRRLNMLRCLHAELQVRAGLSEKMLRLKVRANL